MEGHPKIECIKAKSIELLKHAASQKHRRENEKICGL